MRKKPSSLVVAVVVRPPARVAVTVTPGTAAPVGSVTVPSIDPVVVVWANTLPANSAKLISNADKAKNLKTFFIFCFPFLIRQRCHPLLWNYPFYWQHQRIPKREAIKEALARRVLAIAMPTAISERFPRNSNIWEALYVGRP